MALTLLESAKLAQNQGDVLRGTVMEVFATGHPLVEALPFESIQGSAYKWNREDSLATVAFRGINGSFTPSEARIETRTEGLFIVGGEIDVDTFLLDTHGPGVRASHEAQKIKALSHKLGYTLIKGDNSADPAVFNGLQKRCTDNGQIVDAGSTNGGDALSLAKLDELIDRVTGATHLIMSQAMRRLITVASRKEAVAGHVTFTQDEMGRQVMRYNGLPILEVDGNRIAEDALGFNEAGSGGATATATSIYCVSLRPGGLVGLQGAGGMKVDDLGQIDDKPVHRTRIQMYAGLADLDKYSAARLRGISNAAIVA